MIDKLQNKIKLKILISFLLILILGVSVCPKSIAYLSWTNEEILENIFKISKPNIEVEEKFDFEHKKDIKVKNTGNTDVYVRVALSSFLTDENCDEENCTRYPLNRRVTDFNLDSNWLKIDDYYYYRKVLAEGDITTDLLNGGSIDNIKVDGKKLQVDVVSQSLQATPVDAVEKNWGIKISQGIVGANHE